MALQAFEGFENLAVSDLSLLSGWTWVAPGTASFPAGRLSGSAFAVSNAAISVSSNTFRGLGRVLVGSQQQMVAGIALFGAVDTVFPTIILGVVGETNPIIALMVNSGTGAISIRSSNANTSLATSSSGLVQNGVWSYIELSVDIGGGLVNVRQNGATVLSYSGSIANGSARIDRVGPCVLASVAVISAFPIVDDFYLLDSTGTRLNTFLGDSRVVPRLPTSDSSTTLTPSGGGGNFAQVDEALQNGDTDYVAGVTAGLRDRYTSSVGIPGSPTTVHAVGLRQFVRKTDATVRTVRQQLRSGVTDSAGATVATTTSYVGYTDFFPLDPATGTAWTEAAVEATQFGPEIVT